MARPPTRKFRDVGERHELFVQINAARKELAGNLAKLALTTPGLPTNFHEQFFSPEEGLYSWLMRVTAEAIERGERDPEGRIRYLNMTFALQQGNESAARRASSPKIRAPSQDKS